MQNHSSKEKQSIDSRRNVMFQVEIKEYCSGVHDRWCSTPQSLGPSCTTSSWVGCCLQVVVRPVVHAYMVRSSACSNPSYAEKGYGIKL